jgi:hypothetical protein
LAGNFLVEQKDEKSEEVKNEIELPFVNTQEGEEKVDHYHPPLPVINEDLPVPVEIVQPNPYFVPSPTQAITSWTTSTTYAEPDEEEPVFSEPELPEAEPVVETPVEEEREIIKLDQLIKHPEHKPTVVRSSLESIDARASDIITSVDDSTPFINSSIAAYREPAAEAVTVGGPFAR